MFGDIFSWSGPVVIQLQARFYFYQNLLNCFFWFYLFILFFIYKITMHTHFKNIREYTEHPLDHEHSCYSLGEM